MAAKKSSTKKNGIDTKVLAAAASQSQENPNVPVAATIALADRTRQLAAPMRTRLAKIPDFEIAHFDLLARAAALLAAAETDWNVKRSAGRSGISPANVKKAEALKREMVSTIAYVKRKDVVVQQQLEDIAEGTGIADLAFDLKALATLVDTYESAVVGEDRLGKTTAADARSLSDKLITGPDVGGAADAQALRNQLFWFVTEATREVRDGLRFLWRKEPTKIAQLGPTYATRMSKGRKVRAKAKAKKNETK